MKKFLTFTGILALVLVAVPAFAAAPDGLGPFADTVEGSNQALKKDGGAVNVDRSDPAEALGVAESTGADYDNPVVGGSFFSLGFGGDITLGFDNAIIDGEGDDFQIYEITGGSNYPDELVDIEISDDGTNWWLAAEDVQRDALIDLDGTPFECIHYVRVTDVSDPNLFNGSADGYDVDAGEALHSDENACADTDSSIEVIKSSDAPESGVFEGTLVTYTYMVTNTGDFDLNSVVLEDDICEPETLVGGDGGDDGDGLLNPGETWEYECSMVLNETTTNHVDVMATDPFENNVEDDDELQVVVKVPGCTLTQGYWKNHHPDGNASKDDLAWGAGDPINSEWDWLEVFQTPPKGGNVWYKLSHQWMAAWLNVESGADDTDLGSVLADAGAWLEAHPEFEGVAKSKTLKGFDYSEYDSSWAGILASFNEGEIGPGHCSDVDTSVTGQWLLSVNDGAYEHDMFLVEEAGGVLSGTGGYPAGGAPYSYPYNWTLVGQLTGSDVSMTISYENSYEAAITGTVNGALDFMSGGAGTGGVSNWTAVLIP